MNDLERDLRTLLARKADEARLAPHAPRLLLRRATRRQLGTLLVSALAAVAVVTGSIVGVRALLRFDGDPVPGSTQTRTAKVGGVTITYPVDWSLIELHGEMQVPAETLVDLSARVRAREILQLSNFEPDGDGPLCPIGDGDIPEGGVAFYVRELDEPTLLQNPPEVWPGRSSTDIAQEVCGGLMGLRFEWTANGRFFDATFVGEAGTPAFDRLNPVQRSLQFDAAQGDSPAAGETLITGEYDGRPFELVAYVIRGHHCIGERGSLGSGRCAEPGDRTPFPGGPAQLGLASLSTLDLGGSDVEFAGWGTTIPEIVDVRARLNLGGTWEATLVSSPGPPGEWGEFNVFVLTGTGTPRGDLIGYGTDGRFVARAQLN